MKTVEIPGYGDVEFPDEMTDEQIVEAIDQLSYEDLGVKSAAPPPDEPPAPASSPASSNFFGSGFLRGLKDPLDAGAQLLPRGLAGITSLGGLAENPVSRFFDQEANRVDQLVKADEQAYLAERGAQGDQGFDWARLGGNVLNPVNIAGGVGLARVVPQGAKILGSTVAPTVARSALVGGGLGALTPVTEGDFAEQKATQVGLGAALGPLTELGARGIARVVRPQTAPEVRRLLDEGIRLTPGQILGGPMKRLEDLAQSYPIAGDAIRASRTRGIEDLNRAAANRALSPIGARVAQNAEPGRDLLTQVRNEIQGEYRRLLPKLTFNPDQQFATDLATTRGMAAMLPEREATQFERILDKTLFNKSTPYGNMNGESFKAVESQLSRLVKGYKSSSDFDQRQLGDALEAVLIAARENLIRSNPAQAGALSNVNRAWANYSILRKAAGYQGAEEGVFTPAQLSAAVRASSGGVDKSRFAHGTALMQDLSGAAKATLPDKVPNSGTVDRLMLGGTLAGGLIQPSILAPSLAGAAMYSRPTQYLLRQALTSRPAAADPLAQLVRKYGQPALAAGVVPAIETGG